MGRDILKVDDLHVTFQRGRASTQAVRGVSLRLAEGEVLGVVGESGCGKSAMARALLGLTATNARITGSVCLEGTDMLSVDAATLRRIRGRQVTMVFQDPMSSLNPVLTVGRQIDDVITAHQEVSRDERGALKLRLLRDVGINEPERRLRQYPHELSGGMRQRVMIAMALANEPSLIIADEPTTALDVTIQAQILDLFASLNERRRTALLIISHDLGVIARICTRVVVLYAGEVVEEGDVRELFNAPMHPYTRALVDSIPQAGRDRQPLRAIPGAPPSLSAPPAGCAFAPRCPDRHERCDERPVPVAVGARRRVACWLAENRP